LASRRGSFGRFYSAKEAPKPRWDRNSYGCGIISDKGTEIVLEKETHLISFVFQQPDRSHLDLSLSYEEKPYPG